MERWQEYIIKIHDDSWKTCSSMHNIVHLPSDILQHLLPYLNSKELCLIDRTNSRLQLLARSLQHRVQLPDGSFRSRKIIKTKSSGILVCSRFNTRPERPRDYINHDYFQ